jgi:hypothetical protein
MWFNIKNIKQYRRKFRKLEILRVDIIRLKLKKYWRNWLEIKCYFKRW